MWRRPKERGWSRRGGNVLVRGTRVVVTTSIQSQDSGKRGVRLRNSVVVDLGEETHLGSWRVRRGEPTEFSFCFGVGD